MAKRNLAVSPCNEKIEIYKAYLKLPYWTITEIQWLLCGITKFKIYAVMHPYFVPLFKRTRYGICPALEDQNEIQYLRSTMSAFIKTLIAAIDENQIEALPIKMLEFPARISDREGLTIKGISFILKPFDLIAFAAIQSFALPQELQIAAEVYPKKTDLKPMSVSKIKQLKREAIALAYWHKYPKSKISKLSEKINTLKSYQQYDFIYASAKRARNVVQGLKPINSTAHICLPGSIEIQSDTVSLDFQEIKVVINTIAEWLIETSGEITEEKIMSHPLINSYILQGGIKVESVIKFALKPTFTYLKDHTWVMSES